MAVSMPASGTTFTWPVVYVTTPIFWINSVFIHYNIEDVLSYNCRTIYKILMIYRGAVQLWVRYFESGTFYVKTFPLNI